MIGWYVTLALLLLLVVFVIVQYNRLVAGRLHIHESWANVDTELKRRHDLIPNLVATVQGYARHERELFALVTQLRTRAVAESRDTDERLAIERDLARAVGRLVAVAEAYPQLRASQNFLQLQRELTTTEDRIQASRRFYNGNVRDYNNRVQQFPSNLVARSFGFEAHTYFELPSLQERLAPTVSIQG